MKTVEDPQIQAAAARLDAPISREQFLAGRDLAVSVLSEVEKYNKGGEYWPNMETACEAMHRQKRPQKTLLASALAKIHADPTLIPGFDSILTDHLTLRSEYSSKEYSKLTLKELIGVERKQAPRRLEDETESRGLRNDLSFTDFNGEPNFRNWTPAPNANRMTDDDTYPMGRNCMREIAKMAAISEDAAHTQIGATLEDFSFKIGYGKERGFVCELAKYAVIGMRAARAGVVNKDFDFEIYLDDGAIL